MLWNYGSVSKTKGWETTWASQTGSLVLVPREVLWRCPKKWNIPEAYISTVQDTYQGATTCVKSKRRTTEQFEVAIGLHQGSALSPFRVIMLVDTISQDVFSSHHGNFSKNMTWQINDTATMIARERSQRWNNALTDSGLEINVSKHDIWQQGRPLDSRMVKQAKIVRGPMQYENILNIEIEGVQDHH